MEIPSGWGPFEEKIAELEAGLPTDWSDFDREAAKRDLRQTFEHVYAGLEGSATWDSVWTLLYRLVLELVTAKVILAQEIGKLRGDLEQLRAERGQ